MKRQNEHASTSAWLSVLSAVLVAGAVLSQLVRSLKWGRDSWNMTEWLIDYAGGFVRRGLPGEIIRRFAQGTGLHANHIAIAVSFAAFAVLVVLFLRWGRGRTSAYLMLSPVLFAAPAYEDFIVRKDVLDILLLIAGLGVAKRIGSGLAGLVLMNLIAVVAVLSHEPFFFFCFPALLLAAAEPVPENDRDGIKAVAIGLVKFSPVVAAFAVTIVFHGSPAIAQAINDSWRDLWKQIDPRDCCLGNPASAIDAMQWSTAFAISYPASTLKMFSWGIYVPLAWVVTAALCTWFLVGLVTEAEAARHRLATVLVIQFVVMLPMCVLGWDYGRWIFLWTASSVAVHLLELDAGFGGFHWLTHAPADVIARWATRWPPRPYYLLVFGIPSCCWSCYVYVSATPLGYYFRLLQAHLK